MGKLKGAKADRQVKTLDRGSPLDAVGGVVTRKTHVDIQCPAFTEGEFNALVLRDAPSEAG